MEAGGTGGQGVISVCVLVGRQKVECAHARPAEILAWPDTNASMKTTSISLGYDHVTLSCSSKSWQSDYQLASLVTDDPLRIRRRAFATELGNSDGQEMTILMISQ